MPSFLLYVDDSTECRRIEEWLDEKGVGVLPVRESSPTGILPTLDWPRGRLEGTANIRLYFERRLPRLALG